MVTGYNMKMITCFSISDLIPCILSFFLNSVCKWMTSRAYLCTCPPGGGAGSQTTFLHEEQWKMPALPALLLSIHLLFLLLLLLLLTMAPSSHSQAPTLAAVRMGESTTSWYKTHKIASSHRLSVSRVWLLYWSKSKLWDHLACFIMYPVKIHSCQQHKLCWKD